MEHLFSEDTKDEKKKKICQQGPPKLVAKILKTTSFTLLNTSYNVVSGQIFLPVWSNDKKWVWLNLKSQLSLASQKKWATTRQDTALRSVVQTSRHGWNLVDAHDVSPTNK